MVIQHITIENFGALSFYRGDFSPELNLIQNRHISQIAQALAFLLCSTSPEEIPASWIGPHTRLSALVCMEQTVYSLHARLVSGRLQLFAADPSGADATARYRCALAHCPEQDQLDSFDGRDKMLPLRLQQYRFQEERQDLSTRTRRLADTKTFRSYLCGYIRSFRPEPINCGKNYLAAISPQGLFYPFYPGHPGPVFLSETEEKLFLYLCFLNIAEFWAGFEAMRDLHHEKKPLVIQNFIEFLDKTTQIQALLARTAQLHRQVMLLTPTLGEETNENWLGKEDSYGIFFKPGHRLPSPGSQLYAPGNPASLATGGAGGSTAPTNDPVHRPSG